MNSFSITANPAFQQNNEPEQLPARMRGGVSAGGSQSGRDRLSRVSNPVEHEPVNPFAHATALSNPAAFRSAAPAELEDDYGSLSYPSNWGENQAYPLPPETDNGQTNALTLQNLDRALSIYQFVFEAPFVPDNTVAESRRSAEDRYFSDGNQQTFNEARAAALNGIGDPDERINMIAELLQTYSDRQGSGSAQSALALSSHDLTAYAYEQYIEFGDAAGLHDEPGERTKLAAIINQPTANGQVVSADDSHCFLVIGDYDTNIDLEQCLLNFKDLNPDDPSLKLAIVDMYTREVYNIADLQDQLDKLNGPNHPVAVAELNILATSIDFTSGSDEG